jgi:hypothetical protein
MRVQADPTHFGVFESRKVFRLQKEKRRGISIWKYKKGGRKESKQIFKECEMEEGKKKKKKKRGRREPRVKEGETDVDTGMMEEGGRKKVCRSKAQTKVGKWCLL